MAGLGAQAWLTYVQKDEHTTWALVLAKSIRKTQTTKRIGVIIFRNISSDRKRSLRKSFDHVFLMDDDVEKNWKAENIGNDVKAKIFAFSLDVFEKCIFLEPNSMLLENSDWLFEGNKMIMSLKNYDEKQPKALSTTDYFLLKPCKLFFKYLVGLQIPMKQWESEGVTQVIVRHAQKWMENNFPIFENDDTFTGNDEKWKNSVKQLSLENGSLYKRECWDSPCTIQFVDIPTKKSNYVDKLRYLQSKLTLGLTEKVLIKIWLKLFDESTMQNMCTSEECYLRYPNEPIAITGISCRLPGANNLEEFWNLLHSGQEGVREPPPFRWKKEHCCSPVGKKERSTCAGFLSTAVDEFDAKFFGVSPKEAVFMDPQTRLLHEVMWESLENAGVDPTSLYGSHTGIFTGSWMNDYKDIVQRSSSRDFFRTYMGNSIGASASRLSFLLGLTGPSIATESGCSSAIVAVDLAVKSLRNGETNLALAGGVNFLLHPFESGIIDYVIAPDGRCKTFDAKADGFGRAEGCGVLVLKRLSDALRDKDNIWAMIRGSAVSQEGISRSLGTPTVHCEALAMQLALKNGGVRPEQVSFVETHGTGTAVGDPMEVAAIAKAYRSKNRNTPLVIGSVKTNVGHTESVSGITGIIKTILALQHEIIPKHLNFETLNPDVNLDAVPAVIPIEPIPWPKVKGQPRFAGVSSFGITGTDGHVILQDAPDNQLDQFNVGLERPLHIFKISAKSRNALDQLLAKYEEVFNKLGKTDKKDFSDVAFTANIGRSSFEHRAFLLASNFQNAADAIQQNKLVRADVGEAGRKICFLFTGQGSQYQGMAKSLYETSPVFRYHFDHCASTLEESYNVTLCKIIWESDPDSKELSRTIYSQTSIFCVEYCLLKLWESWGLQPDYVLGHSLGEFCAAVAAGILTFEDALKLVAIRSELIDKLPRGSMLVLKANQKQVEDMMKSANIQLDFAAINSPEQTVMAGDTQKITDFQTICKKNDIKGVILEATHAFHSSHMDPMLEEYRKVAESFTYNQSKEIQYISGMEGKLWDELDADYWVRHTRENVNFLEACKTIGKLDCANFLEIGPHPVLSIFVLQNLEERQIFCYPSLRRQADDWETMLTSFGRLWIDGYNVNWNGFDQPYLRQKVTCLPFYPFHRKSYWMECNEAMAVPIHPLIGTQLNNASSINIFQNDLNINTLPYLKDHCIGNRIVLPGAAFAEMCLSAGYCVANFLKDTLETPSGSVVIEDFRIGQPLELKEARFCKMQVIVDHRDTGEEGKVFRCKVFHQNQIDIEESSFSGKWVLHATATFHPVLSRSSDLQNWNVDRIKELIASKDPMQLDGFYKRIDAIGLRFGDTFRSIQKQWLVKQEDMGELDELVAEMKIPQDFDKYLLHPLIIDAMFQAQILAEIRSQKLDALRVPVRIGKLILFKCLAENYGYSVKLSTVKMGDEKAKKQNVLYIHAKWLSKENCSLFVCTEDFVPVAMMEDVELLETNVKTIMSVLEQQNRKIPDCWEEVWKPIPGPSDNRVKLVNLKPVISSPSLEAEVMAASKVVPEDEGNFKRTDCVVVRYTLRALFQLGWNPKKGEEFTVSEFCEKYKIKPEFKQLVYFYFRMFQDDLRGFLEPLGKDVIGQEKIWKVKSVPYNSEENITNEISILHQQLSKVESHFGIVKIYENVAKHLTEYLKGEENATQILFPMEPERQLSVETFYKTHPAFVDVSRKCIASLRTYLGVIGSSDIEKDKNSIFRVMEVGAGTGLLSISVLQVFKDLFGTKFEYYFTDINSNIFSKVDKILEEFRPNIKFATFNIEENPLSQGIPVNYFDCVLASDVLHATSDLKECLTNLRMTLTPNGILNFTETFVQDNGITFQFGLLEDYWRFQDFEVRNDHPCVSGQTWKELLLGAGFGYAHCVEAYYGVMGSIVGQANEQSAYFLPKIQVIRRLPMKNKKKWLIFAPENDSKLIIKLKNILEISGNKVDVVVPTSEMEIEEDDKSAKYYNFLKTREYEELCGIIFACGMVQGFQDQRKLALPFLHIAKSILNESKPPRLYVFTNNVHSITDEENQPFPATLHGMAKTLKNENPDLFVRCVDLEINFELNAGMDHIFYELAMFKETNEKERVQVAYRNNQRYEPKFCKVVVQQQSKCDLRLPPNTGRYQMALPESRMINDLKLVPLKADSLGELEVEVKIKAFALNFRDLFAIMKPTAEFEKFNTVGLDYAGVVSKVGEAVKPEVARVGDRVAGFNLKQIQLPSHLTTDADSVVKIPENINFSAASTLLTVSATSIYCLMDIVKLRKGEAVLIHTGSGGVGLCAIQLARHIGANIITTAGSHRKRKYLRSLGIEHVFHSRSTNYKNEIMKVTNGRGVDVVLNSITGPDFKEATLAVCAENARFVEMSKLNVWTKEEVRFRRSDVQYSIVDLTQLPKKILSQLQEKTNELVKNGIMTAIPYVKFDIQRIRQALQLFQKAKHIGKVVVTMPEVTTEHGQWTVKISLFDSSSTYLITGGLGGIGFEVCKWMLERGASDIVLIGRSPPKPEVSKELEQINRKHENNVMVRLVDVGNLNQTKELIDELTGSGFKPVRGIQHCAGILWDNCFENQTWESFMATFNPKVEGTWNLHQLTKHLPLEHFVLYSSMTSLVGTPCQANHVAANCFEDAFAHYRYSLGLPATAINWGQWSQVGVAKEINLTAVMPVSVARMLNGLEEVMRNHRVQTAFGEFESLNMLTAVCPSFKFYLDERLKNSVNDSKNENQTDLLQSAKFWQEMDKAETTDKQMGVATNYIKIILRNALRIDVDDVIKDDANMHDLGVDSLLFLELKNNIQTLLGSRLTITSNMLKDCQTVRELATAVINKIDDEQGDLDKTLTLSPEELMELLNEDCQLDESIQPENKLNLKPSEMKTVFITGVTGQLGPYILSRICQIGALEKIICIIRTKKGITPEGRLKDILKSMNLEDEVDMNKLKCLQGNGTHENFGLDKAEYDQLCESVDGIIHLAAKNNHAEAYRKIDGKGGDVRSVNVGGTREILKFAAKKKTKYVYYSSSILSGFGSNNENTLSDEWPETEKIKLFSENVPSGYLASLLVTEIMLKQASERGIPCKIFRFPWIMGHSKTGQVNYYNNKYILKMLTFLKLKAMPLTPFPAIVLPVDICADLSIKIFLDDKALPSDVYNITLPYPQMEAEFVQVAWEDFNTKVELVEWKNEEFFEKLYASDIPTAILKEMYQEFYSILTSSITDLTMHIVQGFINSHDSFFKNEKLEKLMPGFEKDLPTSMDIIRRNLEYVKNAGFLKKFGL